MHPSSTSQWSDARGNTQPGPGGRPSHNLPTRPDSQPLRARQSDRGSIDRSAEHGMHSRYETRGPPNDYGRLDRPGDAGRQREASPNRRARVHPGGRTPERLAPGAEPREWGGRDVREFDDRGMRGPLRDARAPPVRPPPNWDSRDSRDMRDQRDRPDSRGHAAPSLMEPRRMASNSSLAHEHTPHRRDLPAPIARPVVEREDYGPPRPSQTAPPPAAEGPMVNPARAALINQVEHGRPEIARPDRDNRRDRGSRPQSPRRGEDRRPDERRPDDRRLEERPPAGYHNRNEAPRDYREDRMQQQAPPSSRDRREEATTNTPTGPRGGRNEAAPSNRASREMFQPTQGPRSSHHQAQDPNYGRLNQPSDSMPPSGPRGEFKSFNELTTC